MADLSVSQNQSLAALRQQQDDEIRPVGASLAEQVRPSTTPLVPYHFTGSATDPTQQAFASKKARLEGMIGRLGKKDPEADPIGFARAHMTLEGKALSYAPGASYQDMHQHLAELGGTTHPMLSGREETDAFSADLDKYLSKNEIAREAGGGFKTVWDAHCERVGNTLGAYHSLCQEVIDNSLGHEDLPHLVRSHAAFRGYAKGVMKAMTEEMPTRLSTFLDSRIAHAEQAASNDALPQADQDKARDDLVKLQEVRTELSELLEKDGAKPATPSELDKATKANEGLDTALKNVARQDHVAELKTQTGFVTGLAVFVDAGIPQGVASAGHFGASTSAIDEAMADTAYGKHVAATSTVLGAAHKVISDGIRPFVQVVVDKTIGKGLAKVDPLAVYPKPLQDITVNGRRIANPQFAALDTSQAQKRDEFKLKQNANNFGTMSGDFTGYLAFGAAHAVRDTLDQFSSVNASGIVARSVASAVGGTFMAGGQAVAKYAQTHGEEQIPTYRVTTEKRNWGELLPKAFSEAAGKLHPASMTNLSDYANRIVSVGEGIALRTAVGDASEASDDATVEEKLEQVVATFFNSGLTLFPFFANSVAAPLENKAMNADKADNLAQRANVPLQNILHPNRDSLPHTQPEGLRRNLENTYHVARGFTQIVPQTAIAGLNKGTDKIQQLATRSRNAPAGDNFELAERGQLQPQGNPPGEGQSSTKPA
ncbi:MULTISPECIES: type III effector [Pseudomonas]|uniref:type III effector n=1 Tax=Pseudomonas TaxID=286 RepID=UPI001BE81A78|nr:MULTISPECIES: type III effector [Pseudomonas]MBT2340263.1 type III effector [Pseudomonas fluorescens]MCD4530271.1 type III effector [Pseudomonas sp. C3-2018]